MNVNILSFDTHEGHAHLDKRYLDSSEDNNDKFLEDVMGLGLDYVSDKCMSDDDDDSNEDGEKIECEIVTDTYTFSDDAEQDLTDVTELTDYCDNIDSATKREDRDENLNCIEEIVEEEIVEEDIVEEEIVEEIVEYNFSDEYSSFPEEDASTHSKTSVIETAHAEANMDLEVAVEVEVEKEAVVDVEVETVGKEDVEAALKAVAETVVEQQVKTASEVKGETFMEEEVDAALEVEVKAKPKPLNTPLGSMLPQKYAALDVKDLFPDFDPNKRIRMLKLFGSDVKFKKQEWDRVRKRLNKKKELSKQFPESITKSRNPKLQEISPDLIASDDEDKLLLSNYLADSNRAEKSVKDSSQLDIPAWRHGPARYWYDMLKVPETGEQFDYGFKLATETKEDEALIRRAFDDEAFLIVNQKTWENDVIWDATSFTEKQREEIRTKGRKAGWTSDRHKTKPVELKQIKNNWYSDFPVENDELVHGRWEDDVIWDAEKMKEIPQPRLPTLDPLDLALSGKFLGVSDDETSSKSPADQPQPKPKISNPHVKKSKMLLGQCGVISVKEEDEQPPPPKSLDKDPFNISNDEFYMPKTASVKITCNTLIQHSIPAVQLRLPFIPTFLSQTRLRSFHRPSLRGLSHGNLAHPGFHPIHSSYKHVLRKMKQREQERTATGGEVFFMRTPEDLTARDGGIVLVEFSEEYPPLMNQEGMCSKIKNYYKRTANNDGEPSEYQYGETVYAHTSPFLGNLVAGQSVQAIENKMYRAPIYRHAVPETDFLVIRTRDKYYIRSTDALFLAGQQCPLTEVPGPNSKRVNDFLREFLNVFIYRLFWSSRDTPRRIRMDDIKRAFPLHSESSIRKRLKVCADFKRTGMHSNWWVLKPDFRLPSEDEIRELVSPEMCCAYFSMLAAEERLRDAGYNSKSILADENENENESEGEDETKVAPWNTTRNYVQAMRGKCMLQLTGYGDPTGCGEGFSYIKVPNKPVVSKEEREAQQKRTLKGTDADLRKLSLKDARELLRKEFKVSEEILKLSRWEIIAMVRIASTERAKEREDEALKFSRGNKFSIAEHKERYRQECQRIFDLQNSILASREDLSTDEGESSDEGGSDVEEMAKNIEQLLSDKVTSRQLRQEREEQQYRELKKMMLEDTEKKKGPEEQEKRESRVLRITRTFFDTEENRNYTRVEVVRDPDVIDAYLKVRNSKDEAFIRRYTCIDEEKKEEMKKEKRRIQEQLRRIRRNEEKMKSSRPSSPCTSSSSSPKRQKLKADLKMKCGACGNVGHIRTNKACPIFCGEGEEDEAEYRPDLPPIAEEEQSLVNVEGTKVKISTKVIRQDSSRIGRPSEVLERDRHGFGIRDPKESAIIIGRKRKIGGSDYPRLQKIPRRQRTDPQVVISSIFEGILNEMRELPGVQLFCLPVNRRLVPDYRQVVRCPMDLQTMRENLRRKKYQSREEFLVDVHQIVENSNVYNGPNNPLSLAAKGMLELCVRRLAENEAALMDLEKAINPLLDDDRQVALAYILGSMLNEKMKVAEAAPFLKPVDRKVVRNYYDIIKKPMDLATIERKIAAKKYQNRTEFLRDVELIAANAARYNGEASVIARQAKKLVQICKAALKQYQNHLDQVEGTVSLEENGDVGLEFGTSRDSDSFRVIKQGSDHGESSDEFIDVEGDQPKRTLNVLQQDLMFSSDDESDVEKMKEDENMSESVDGFGEENGSWEKSQDIGYFNSKLQEIRKLEGNQVCSEFENNYFAENEREEAGQNFQKFTTEFEDTNRLEESQYITEFESNFVGTNERVENSENADEFKTKFEETILGMEESPDFSEFESNFVESNQIKKDINNVREFKNKFEETTESLEERQVFGEFQRNFIESKERVKNIQDTFSSGYIEEDIIRGKDNCPIFGEEAVQIKEDNLCNGIESELMVENEVVGIDMNCDFSEYLMMGGVDMDVDLNKSIGGIDMQFVNESENGCLWF